MVICLGRWHHEAMPERQGAAAAAATARLPWNPFEPVHTRPWSRLTPSRAAELAELLRSVATAAAAALPFPACRSAGANGQLTTHASPEPS